MERRKLLMDNFTLLKSCVADSLFVMSKGVNHWPIGLYLGSWVPQGSWLICNQCIYLIYFILPGVFIQRLFVAIICFEMVWAVPSHQFLDLSWVGKALDLFRNVERSILDEICTLWKWGSPGTRWFSPSVAHQIYSRKFAHLFICPSLTRQTC